MAKKIKNKNKTKQNGKKNKYIKEKQVKKSKFNQIKSICFIKSNKM